MSDVDITGIVGARVSLRYDTATDETAEERIYDGHASTADPYVDLDCRENGDGDKVPRCIYRVDVCIEYDA